MKILSIDTSGQAASVAVISDNQVLAEFTLNGIAHSVTLMPLLNELFKAVDMEASDMDYIAAACGPGSFTGLRIGAAAAKALAHAAGKRLVPVSTLLGLAYNVLVSDKIIVPIMDAKRDQVYSAAFVITPLTKPCAKIVAEFCSTARKYRRCALAVREEGLTQPVEQNYRQDCARFSEWSNRLGGKLETLLDTTADDIGIILDAVKGYERPAVFIGDGTLVYEKQILDSGFEIASPGCNFQRASSVGLAAVPLIYQGLDVSYNEFEIIYARKPQAEREADLKLQNG